jgi:hypothetical protein
VQPRLHGLIRHPKQVRSHYLRDLTEKFVGDTAAPVRLHPGAPRVARSLSPVHRYADLLDCRRNDSIYGQGVDRGRSKRARARGRGKGDGHVSTPGVPWRSVVIVRLLFGVIFLISTVQLCIAGQWGVAGLAFLIMALCVPKARVRRA